MKFGLFYEHQLPRPWGEDAEQRIVQDALTQIELADRLGYDCIWAVEHHFLEEYAHCSAPEVFLAAVAQRTRQIRIGHGVMLMIPDYNPPARCAERLAMLDLVSNGRVEWGTGESSSALELQGFNVQIENKREIWRESVEQCARMMSMTPYPGYEGKYFSMPCRNVVPKPVQKPHPPMWVACTTPDTVALAGRLGLGALIFQFTAPETAAPMVEDYYNALKTECVPIGETVNPNICVVSPLSIHPDREEAIRRGAEGFAFFGRSLRHHYVDGEHKPGVTDVWNRFQSERAADAGPKDGWSKIPGGVGTADEVRAHLEALEKIGVDQVGFVMQVGNTRHEHICDALKLFAAELMPAFKARGIERQKAKEQELAPYIEAALQRKKDGAPPPLEDIPTILTLPKQVEAAAAQKGGLEEWQRQRLVSSEGLDKINKHWSARAGGKDK